jgi:hypothetical protein
MYEEYAECNWLTFNPLPLSFFIFIRDFLILTQATFGNWLGTKCPTSHSILITGSKVNTLEQTGEILNSGEHNEQCNIFCKRISLEDKDFTNPSTRNPKWLRTLRAIEEHLIP